MRLKHLILGAIIVFVFSACANGQTNKTNTEKVMKTIEINKEQFLEKVVNYEKNPTEWKYLGDKPAIIDFYASWCGPCKMVAPILEELAAEYGDSIVIYKVNTEKEQPLSAEPRMSHSPTIDVAPTERKPEAAQGTM